MILPEPDNCEVRDGVGSTNINGDGIQTPDIQSCALVCAADTACKVPTPL